MTLTNLVFVQEFAELAREILGVAVIRYDFIHMPIPDDDPSMTFGLRHGTSPSVGHVPFSPDPVLAHAPVESNVVEHLIHELGHALTSPEWVADGERATRYEFGEGEKAAQAFSRQVCARLGWVLISDANRAQWSDWRKEAELDDEDGTFDSADWTWDVWVAEGDTELRQHQIPEEHYERVVAFFRQRNFPQDLVLRDQNFTILFPEAVP
jgi:hypothetical protein